MEPVYAPEPLAVGQITIVVEDIEEALERYHRGLGWGDRLGVARGSRRGPPSYVHLS